MTTKPEAEAESCRTCACQHSRVVWTRQLTLHVRERGSRDVKPIKITRRKRECRHCQRTYITTERHES